MSDDKEIYETRFLIIIKDIERPSTDQIEKVIQKVFKPYELMVVREA